MENIKDVFDFFYILLSELQAEKPIIEDEKIQFIYDKMLGAINDAS